MNNPIFAKSTFQSQNFFAIAAGTLILFFSAAQAFARPQVSANTRAGQTPTRTPTHTQLRPVTKTLATRSAIRFVLRKQAQDWNRGDIAAFMRGYKNSPDTTFIGKKIEHGYQAVLARYQAIYSNREKMGHLDFANLDIRMLGNDYAIVTGEFHLARTPAGGGDASGVFSLLFRNTAQGWRIILDHTS